MSSCALRPSGAARATSRSHARSHLGQLRWSKPPPADRDQSVRPVCRAQRSQMQCRPWTGETSRPDISGWRWVRAATAAAASTRRRRFRGATARAREAKLIQPPYELSRQNRRGSEPPAALRDDPGMSFLEALAIFGAGIAAGTINTVVGSGTLFTFPVL